MKQESKRYLESKNKPGTRRRILDAALLEFSEHGLAGGRVDRIAASAVANKAMIYYHFASKEGLYKAVITREVENLGRIIRRTVDEGADLESILRAVAEYYLIIWAAENRFTPIIIREMASGGGEFREALKNVVSRAGIPEKLKGMIDEGKLSGKYRNVDSRQAMVSFMGMNLFYLIFSPMITSIWEITDEKEFRQKRAAEVVDLFMRGLEARRDD